MKFGKKKKKVTNYATIVFYLSSYHFKCKGLGYIFNLFSCIKNIFKTGAEYSHCQ